MSNGLKRSPIAKRISHRLFFVLLRSTHRACSGCDFILRHLPHLPVVEVREGLADFLAGVHDKRTVTDHGFVDGLAVHDKEDGVLVARFDFHVVTFALEEH